MTAARQRTFADIRPGPTPAGEIGIASSHEHAETDEPGWTDRAVDALRAFARTAAEFTIEQARACLIDRVGEPDELRAWGAVTQAAQRRGFIERTGAYRPAISSNGSPKPVYRAGPRA